MPLIQSSASIAAASVNDNLLSGSQFEFAPFNAMVEFGVNGDANGADMRVDVYSGSDMITEQMVLNAQARIPLYPDDFILQDVVAAGERIKIRARNTHATLARTVYYSVRLTQL